MTNADFLGGKGGGDGVLDSLGGEVTCLCILYNSFE